MRRGRRALLAALAAALAACAIQPIYGVRDAPIPAAGGAPPGLADVQKAIERAGAALGWRTHAVRPGLLVATLQTRSHTAVVEITFDTRTYSIAYSNSANLSYDGVNIHRSYNAWVQSLDRVIRAQLDAL
jgi:hypothetical protein